MFAVLQVESAPQTGIFGRFLHRMKRRSFHIEEVETQFGSFLRITVYCAEAVPWEQIADETGRLARRMVLPPGLEPAEGVGRFQPQTLPQVLLLNLCTSLTERMKQPLYRKVVTLVDLEGRYQAFVRPLLCHCMTVKVVTQDGTGYGQLSAALMEELGAGIVYADSFGLCEGSMLVIAPEDSQAAQVAVRVPVLTMGSPDALCGGKLVGELQPVLPDDLRALLPPDIAPLDWAAAFYELNGWRAGAQLRVGGMRCGKNQLEPRTLLDYLARRVHPADTSLFYKDST